MVADIYLDKYFLWIVHEWNKIIQNELLDAGMAYYILIQNKIKKAKEE